LCDDSDCFNLGNPSAEDDRPVFFFNDRSTGVYVRTSEVAGLFKFELPFVEQIDFTVAWLPPHTSAGYATNLEDWRGGLRFIGDTEYPTDGPEMAQYNNQTMMEFAVTNGGFDYDISVIPGKKQEA
jgi:hypothetical protein